MPGASVMAAGTGACAEPGASITFIQGVAAGMPVAGRGSVPVDAGVWKPAVLRAFVDAGV